MRLKVHLLAPLAAAVLLIGGAACADAATSTFGSTVGKFCSAQTDLAPINGKLTAARTRADIDALSELEGVVAQTAAKTGISKKTSPLYKTYVNMEGELLLTGHVYGDAAKLLKSERRLTKAQVTTLTKAYTPPSLALVKQFKAVGATACNH